MTCAGGGLIPDWLPDSLRPWLEGSQGIAMCGVEIPMLVEGVLVLVVLLTVLGKRGEPA